MTELYIMCILDWLVIYNTDEGGAVVGLDFSGTFAKMDRKTAFFRGGLKKSSTGGMGCRGELRE